MRQPCYVFGYLSLLIGSRLDPASCVPAKLHGYRRDWIALRDGHASTRKRYIETASRQPVPGFCFASAYRAGDADWINGICLPVDALDLPAVDFREEGYRRLEVGASVAPYPGWQLAGDAAVYVYVDETAMLGARPACTAPVSERYLQMGLHGASRMEERAPGFLRDYRQTLPMPRTVAGWRFISIDRSGSRLVLLDESDGSTRCLYRFRRPQLKPESAFSGEAQERPLLLDDASEWFGGAGLADLERPEHNPDAALRLAGDPCWLVRMAAADMLREDCAPLRQLAADRDAWVARAARLNLDSLNHPSRR
ncbi:MAG: HEAT repeat domain-containing protein [Zoogloea sp.]|nr:HEAT repeat domain-containing protein [Zoogloea sp.]